MEKTIDLVKFFTKLGLSQVELELYLSLLESGGMTFTDLSRKSKVPRTTVYLNIEKLIEKGLITQAVKNNRNYLQAEPPRKLRLIVESKKLEAQNSLKELVEIEQSFDNMLEEVSQYSSRLQSKAKVGVKYFEGRKGVKMIYQEAFESRELRTYVNLAEVDSFYGEYQQQLLQAHSEHRSQKIRQIIDASAKSVKLAVGLSARDGYDYQTTSLGLVVPGIDILIYENKVAMVNYKEGMVGSIMYNPYYYWSAMMLFDFVWTIIAAEAGEQSLGI